MSDYRALAEFRHQIRKFLRFSEHAVREAGVETGQYQLMLAIKGMPEGVRPRIRELANRMQIQHHSAVELVNRLEAGGFVRRERGQDDRREVLLATDARRASGCWRSWRCIIMRSCGARRRIWWRRCGG